MEHKTDIDFYCEGVQRFHKTMMQPVKQQPTLPDKEVTDRRMNLIAEEALELGEAMQHGSISDIAKEAMDLLYVTFGTLVELGLQHKAQQLFQAVQQSNMSKVSSLAQATSDALAYERDTGDAMDVLVCGGGTEEKQDFIIVRVKDGKIMKPTTYKPADAAVEALLGVPMKLNKRNIVF